MNPNDTQMQLSDGTWRPAIPEPFSYLFRAGCCDCTRRFWTTTGYSRHWQIEHSGLGRVYHDPKTQLAVLLIMTLALLLFLPVLTFAQSPARTVYCLKGDGTTLRIHGDGHYAYATRTNQYTGKVSVEHDRDLLVFGMPAFGHVNLKTHQASFRVLLRTDDKCEAFVDDVMTTEDATICGGLSPEPVKAGLQIGQDGCKIEPSLKRPDSFRSGGQVAPLIVKTKDSPWNLNAKLSVVAITTTATLDCVSTGSLRELNPILRSHGQVNLGACLGLNYGAIGLTVALQKKYPRGMSWFRWIGAGAHAGAASWNWRQR